MAVGPWTELDMDDGGLIAVKPEDEDELVELALVAVPTSGCWSGWDSRSFDEGMAPDDRGDRAFDPWPGEDILREIGKRDGERSLMTILLVLFRWGKEKDRSRDKNGCDPVMEQGDDRLVNKGMPLVSQLNSVAANTSHPALALSYLLRSERAKELDEEKRSDGSKTFPKDVNVKRQQQQQHTAKRKSKTKLRL